MNTSKETNQKQIGFKLSGNTTLSLGTTEELVIDPNKTFEIQIFPGTTPFGIVTYLGRADEKKVLVELPEEIKQSNFEKMCTFFLERNAQLIVKEHGYEKIGNRKLHLELCYDLIEPVVNMSVFIQGKWNSVDYEIELNPFDLSCSVGEIRSPKNYRKANVIMEDLINIKKCDLIKVLPKLKINNFQITFVGDSIKIDLSDPLKQFIDSLGKPSKYQNRKIENPGAYVDEMDDQFFNDVKASDLDQKPSKSSVWPIFRKLIRKSS